MLSNKANSADAKKRRGRLAALAEEKQCSFVAQEMTFGSKWLSNISPDDIMEEIDEKIAITVLNSYAYCLSKKICKHTSFLQKQR